MKILRTIAAGFVYFPLSLLGAAIYAVILTFALIAYEFAALLEMVQEIWDDEKEGQKDA